MTSRAQPLLRGVRVAPSILSADVSRLGEEVAEVLDAGARIIHVDVMDGHFVPPITVGPLVVAGIAEQVHSAGAMLDVHLMIERPERHVADFVKAGADSVTVHAEATPHVAYAASIVRDSGACVGAAINPGTPVEALAELASSIDLALCMSQSLRCAVILAQLLLDQSQLERQGDESLLRAVVQVALQELALLASGFDHPPP